jgi:glycosyltransferase involved in cell wall biosynthesis
MKILFLGIKEWPANIGVKRGGGIGNYCRAIIENLPIKYKVLIITQRIRGYKQSNYEHSARNTILRVPSFNHRLYRLFIGNFFCALKAFLVLKKNKVDLIHVHSNIALLYAYPVAKIYKIPIIVTPHGDPYGFLKEGLKNRMFITFLAWISRRLFHKVDYVIALNSNDKIKIQTYLKQNSFNIRVINSSVSIPKLTKTKENLTNRKVKLLTVGRLTALKGIDKLINAFKLISKEYLDSIHLNIVGDGEEMETLKKIVIKLKLEEQITFNGFIELTDPFYENADIFVFPSADEGFGLALLEAMSYGLACIVNDYGLPFKNNEILLMADNQPNTIAKHINFLIENEGEIIDYGNKARKVVIDEYSIDSFVKEYLMLYDEFRN